MSDTENPPKEYPVGSQERFALSAAELLKNQQNQDPDSRIYQGAIAEGMRQKYGGMLKQLGISTITADSTPIKNHERILTRVGILAEIGRYAKNYTLTRVISDANGLVHLLEVTAQADEPGEVKEYSYRRRGWFKEHKTLMTILEVSDYKDGDPIGSTMLANYDEKTGQWTPALQHPSQETK